MSKSDEKVGEKPVLKTFEDCLITINQVIERRRNRWQLTAISWMDYADVAQNLRLHIWKKWHLYDQKKPLHSWLLVVINNQMINMIRNYYGNFSRPCLKCEFNEGGDLCSKFEIQSTKCDLFRTWVHGKKSAHDIKLPVTMENHQNEVFDIKDTNLDIERNAENIHKKMKTVLRPNEYKVYDLLFIQHKSEEEVGKLMEYKSTEKNRTAGYKQVKNITKIIVNKIKQCFANDEIEIL